MVNSKQMKATKRTRHGYCPEIGHYAQTKYYIGRLKVWTGKKYVIPVELPETKEELANLEEMAMFMEWREKMKAMRMTDSEFEKVLTTKF